MRSLNDQVGTDYGDKVAFYIVGTSPNESVEELDADRQKKGLPWPVAYADEGMLASLNIRSQASKIAISSDGTILHRAGAGTAGFDSWTALFDDIAAN